MAVYILRIILWIFEAITGTIKNSYLLPLISTLLDKLKGTRYFTKLDLRSGYNNVWIKDDDQWKVAFKTSRGLFKPTVMFFGLCSSPATLQQMMDKIIWDEIHKGWIIIYMDDMFIFTRELMINVCHTWRILQKLQENDLFVKPEKCVFWQNKVEYLGMIIEEDKIGMDPVKLQGIADWPLPKTVKDIWSFLGFRNYYWKFINGYGDLTTLLNISGGTCPPDARPAQTFCGWIRCIQVHIRSSVSENTT